MESTVVISNLGGKQMKSLYLRMFVIFAVIGISKAAHSQENPWKDFQKDSIVSGLDGEVQYFYYYKSTGQEKKPLVVFLHQWSANFTAYKHSLVPQTKVKNWNYILLSPEHRIL